MILNKEIDKQKLARRQIKDRVQRLDSNLNDENFSRMETNIICISKKPAENILLI